MVARTPGADGFDKVSIGPGDPAALGPDANAYVNFTGDTNASLVRASYPAETYDDSSR